MNEKSYNHWIEAIQYWVRHTCIQGVILPCITKFKRLKKLKSKSKVAFKLQCQTAEI